MGKLFTGNKIQRKIETKKVVLLAMLASVAVVLGFFTIQLGETIKIGFSGIPNQMVSYLFGPFIGGVFGGVVDILKYLVRPTGPFFPGFTISGIVGGIIYGVILYKKPISVGRIFAAKVITGILIEIAMNTYWLSLLYGTDFIVILPARVIKTAIMIPVEGILLYFILIKLKPVFDKYLQKEGF